MSEALSFKISSMARNRFVWAWTVALLWNFFAVPVLWMQVPRYSGVPERALLIGISLGVGFTALAWSLWETWRWRRFGQSYLHLSILPVPVGGDLCGEISSRPVFSVPPSMEVILRCVRFVTTGSSRRRRTVITTLWEEKQTVQSVLSADLRLPVRFSIPSRGEPTQQQGNISVKWVLTVRAQVPGIDYLAEFEVPVLSQPKN